MRYVDIAEMPPGDDGAWRSGSAPSSPAGAAFRGRREHPLVTTITQTQLTAPPVGDLAGPPGRCPGNRPPRANPRQHDGARPDAEQLDNAAFLLDIDLFVEGPQPFDAEELSRQVTMLHDQIDRFFLWALTSIGEEYFGLEEIT